MKDRLGNVADMLNQAIKLRNTATSREEEHYFEREVYKWKNELMANNINPSDIDSYDFAIKHQYIGFH